MRQAKHPKGSMAYNVLIPTILCFPRSVPTVFLSSLASPATGSSTATLFRDTPDRQHPCCYAAPPASPADLPALLLVRPSTVW